jgi:hypothetical protein
MSPSPASQTFLPHIVRPGEFLSKLAFQYGFDATAVWEHPKNEALRKSRPDPEVLSPGDLIFFPRTPPLSSPLRVGNANDYVLDVPKLEVHTRFQDEDGPWKNERYTVAELEPEKVRETDGNGEIRLQVPLLTPSLTLSFIDRDHEEILRIGDLDPPITLSGIRQRLDGLGFFDASIQDDTGDGLALAILLFQRKHGLKQTGRLDKDTVYAIAKAFGR